MKHSAIYQKKRPTASRWFNKWVQSPVWFFGFWIAVAVCLVVYAANVAFGRVHPGSVWGLSYGIAATAIFVGVFFYAIKRRTMKVRALGRAWFYLQFHVYGGALFLLLMFMHTGFAVPHGVLTWWLWGLSLWTVLSGLFGIVVQKWIPTVLGHGLSVEVHYDRIPELAERLRERAEKLAAGSAPQIRTFYRKHVAATLDGPQTRLIYYLDVLNGLERQELPFARLRPLLPPEEQARLDELRGLFRTKIEMDAHYTLQRALRWWLYLHVPVSLVLIVLLGMHIFSVIYY